MPCYYTLRLCEKMPLTMNKLRLLDLRRMLLRETFCQFSCAWNLNLFFFLSEFFFHKHWRFTGQQGKGGDDLLFHSTYSTRLRTLRHLFATFQVRWLSHIFNRNACVYQTATRWDLPLYRITIWLIDWWCNVCLFTWWIDSRFLLQRFWYWKPLDLNSHRLSPLYYKRTD